MFLLFSFVSVVTAIVGIKSRFLVFSSIKICEELSAKQKSESQQILSLQIRQVKSQSGQFVKDFIPKCRNVFFSAITPNERGYGHLAVSVSRNVPFAGVFAVVKRQSECGSKDR
jgi:hypothetical protein